MAIERDCMDSYNEIAGFYDDLILDLMGVNDNSVRYLQDDRIQWDINRISEVFNSDSTVLHGEFGDLMVC